MDAMHFRCTGRRLVDYPNLWRFTRSLYQMPKFKETVEFDEGRFGHCINDGDDNPHSVIGQQPDIEWQSVEGLDDFHP